VRICEMVLDSGMVVVDNSDKALLIAVSTTGPKNPLSPNNIWNIFNSSIEPLDSVFEYLKFIRSNIILNS